MRSNRKFNELRKIKVEINQIEILHMIGLPQNLSQKNMKLLNLKLKKYLI